MRTEGLPICGILLPSEAGLIGMEPTDICAGDSVAWARTVDGYSSGANWVLTYYLQKSAAPLVTVPTTADAAGLGYAVNVAAETSAAWTPGMYAWKAVIAGTGPNAGQRHTVAGGELVVTPDPAQTHDSRSHVRKCYEAITAVIEGRMGDPIVRYKIGETEAQKLPHWDLLKLQAFYASRLRTEAGRPLMTAHKVVLR